MKLHIHDYSVWSEPMQTYSGNIQQWRVCKVCHKTSFRTHFWHNQTPLSVICDAVKRLLAQEPKV